MNNLTLTTSLKNYLCKYYEAGLYKMLSNLQEFYRIGPLGNSTKQLLKNLIIYILGFNIN